MNWLLAIILSLAACLRLEAAPAQVIVIRHAEKPKDPSAKHLSAAGRERAERLVQFVKSNPEVTRFGLPVALFATHPTKAGGGQRPGETLQPLAGELKLGIENPVPSDHPEKLAQAVLSAPEYDGKTVLICWTHEHIPQLLAALGVAQPPAKLPDDIYDRVYIVRYDKSQTPQLETITQDRSAAPEAKEQKAHHKKSSKVKLHILP